MRVAYLVSRYPAISHTFIRREVAALRARGMSIDTFSVRRTEKHQVTSDDDRVECDRTWSILPRGALAVLKSHVKAVVKRPQAYVELLGTALRHREAGAKAALHSVFYFGEAVTLASELESRNIEHLHVHFANAGGTVAYLAASFLDIGYSLTLHGASDFDTRPRLLAEKIGRARFVVCVTHFGRAQALRAAGPARQDRIFVARCGVETESIPARSAEPLGTRFRLLSVGRLVAEKGQFGLLSALQQLVARGVDAELLVLGEGPERAYLESEIRRLGLEERCQLPGAANLTQVFEALRNSHVFVMSSLMEGLPVVLLEAMASGVPVVAPRLTGIPELVEHGETGMLFHPADWQGLTECILTLQRDPALRAKLSSAGRERVLLEFDLNRAVEPLWQRFNASAVDGAG